MTLQIIAFHAVHRDEERAWTLVVRRRQGRPVFVTRPETGYEEPDREWRHQAADRVKDALELRVLPALGLVASSGKLRVAGGQLHPRERAAPWGLTCRLHDRSTLAPRVVAQKSRR